MASPEVESRRWMVAIAPVVLGMLVYGVFVSAGATASPPGWAVEESGLALECRPPALPTDASLPAPQARAAPVALPPDIVRWWSVREQVRVECVESRKRQLLLENRLADTNSTDLTQARQRLDEEKAAFKLLGERERQLALAPFDLGSRIGFGILDALVALAAVLLLLATSRGALRPKDAPSLCRWFVTYATFVVIGAIAAWATMRLAAGIDDGTPSHVDKLSVGVDSLVVSSSIWHATLYSMWGAVLAFAQPVSMLWLASRSRLAPNPSDVKPTSPDGTCGVGKYVTFLHTWTILAFSFVLVPSIVWIHYVSHIQVDFQPAYLIAPGVGGLLAAVLVGRLVRNAITVRAHYHTAIAGLGTSWTEVQEKKPAPDPTIAFIGEDWWKLPATLGALAAALWAVMEWTGTAKAVTELLR